MNRDTLRQVIVALSVVATIVINALANIIPYNGQTTAEISDRAKVFFVPAGYVFSIWGLIYVGLIAFAVYQALPGQAANPRLRRAGYLLAWSGVANSAWIFLWHYNVFWLTVPMILALLLLLIGVYVRLGNGRDAVSTGEKWCLRVPASIYLGWVTVATIANITAVLYFAGWGGWGLSAVAWTVIMLAAAVGITSAVSLTRGDVAYMLVLIWAFGGIAVKHAAAAVLVSTAAWAAALAVAVMLVVGYIVHRRRYGVAPA